MDSLSEIGKLFFPTDQVLAYPARNRNTYVAGASTDS